jgi:hypothetical protein
VVAAGNTARSLRRFQFGHSVEESGAELVIEGDFQGPVLVQDLATPHRFSKSFLDEKAMGRKLEEFALVGACCRKGSRFELNGDQLLALPADVIRLAGQPMAMGNQHLGSTVTPPITASTRLRSPIARYTPMSTCL